MRHNEPKKLLVVITMIVPAGAATAKEPVGPALGQYGIQISDFCTRFNDMTTMYVKNSPLKVSVPYYSDKSFDILLRIPNQSYFFIRAAGGTKGGRKPKKLLELEPVSYLTPYGLYEILTMLNEYTLIVIDRSSFKKCIHTLRSIGILYLTDEETNLLLEETGSSVE